MSLQAKFNNLNKRERYAIIIGIGVFAVFLIVQFIIEPIFSSTEQKRNTLQTKSVMLEQMRQWQAEYDSLSQKANRSQSRFRNRSKGFTLFAFLNRLAGEARIKDRITNMKPTKKVDKNSRYKLSRVEMKLDAVTLDQLTNYLYKIETSKNMVEVKKISIRKRIKSRD